MADNVALSNIGAEIAVLGSILTDPSCLFDISGILRAEDFVNVYHRWIYESLMKLHQAGDPIDTLTLATELEGAGHLTKVGGSEFIDGLPDRVPAVRNANEYARSVRDLSTRREVLQFSKEVTQLALDRELPVSELLDRISTRALALLGRAQAKSHLRSLASALADVQTRLEAARSGDDLHLPTGYPGLNRHIGGWRRGALHTIGAYTGQGKTALCVNIANRLAAAGSTVLFFSLELSAESLGERILATDTGVSLVKLASGQVGQSDWSQVATSVAGLSKHPMWIDDTPGITIPALRNRIKGFMLRTPLDLVLS